MPYIGSGPIFDKTIESWMSPCYKNWWSTILHVATYSNIDNLCLNWTWYLSADFQLFLFSPVLVYPAWRWRWKFFYGFPVAILLSNIYIFSISMINEFLVFVGPL
jgi:peptidoglycan/LPS O-acetylase OafA/YrhL